jgi:hypothetical protein
MLTAPPAPRRYDPLSSPVMTLIRTLAARRDLWQVAVQKAGFKLELRRHPPAKPAD